MNPVPRQRPAIAIVAALPRELAPLARQLHARRISLSDGVLLESASEPGTSVRVLLASAGMGADRVSLAVAACLAHGPLDILLSVGLAGACDPLLTPGDVVEASLVIDSRSGERFEPTLDRSAASAVLARAVLVTSPRIAGPSEKARLHASYKARAVDMEAATVARLARGHGIRFGAIKAISDEHDLDLTALSKFAGPRGQFRTGAFAIHTLLRPHTWRSTARLGSESTAALANLTRAVEAVLLDSAQG